jgi:anti-sigma factor RsiW
MAFADGRLTDTEAANVERHLAGDAEARRQVEALRRSAALLREAFDRPMHEPPPRALVDRILGDAPLGLAARAERSTAPDPVGSAATEGQPDSRVIRVGEHRKPGGRSGLASFPRTAVALAASLSLAVGIGTGLLIGRQFVASPTADRLALGPVVSGSPIHSLLETRPSGQSVALSERSGNPLRAAALTTFRDRAGRLCREIEIFAGSDADLPIAAAVACRAPRSEWQMEGAARIATDRNGQNSTYVPSGNREKDALDGLLVMLGAGKSLPPDEEQRLIARGWRATE